MTLFNHKISRREFLKESAAYAVVAASGDIFFEASQPLRLAIVGVGATGMECLKELRAIDGIEIVAICDVRRDQLINALPLFASKRAALYDDPDRLFGREKFDAVVLAVPQDVQDGMIKQLLDRRKLLYTERPVVDRTFVRSSPGAKVAVVFGRPLGIPEASRDALETAAPRIQGIQQVFIRCWLDIHEYRANFPIPAGTFAEAIAPALPALGSGDFLVTIGATSQHAATMQDGPWVIHLRPANGCRDLGAAEVHVHLQRSKADSVGVNTFCLYSGQGGTVELRNSDTRPRRHGLAMFVSEASGSGLRLRPERLFEQQVALEFDRAVTQALRQGQTGFEFVVG